MTLFFSQEEKKKSGLAKGVTAKKEEISSRQPERGEINGGILERGSGEIKKM